MKKFTAIIITLLFAASAPVASAADWKEEFVSGFLDSEAAELLQTLGGAEATEEDMKQFRVAMWEGMFQTLSLACTKSAQQVGIKRRFPKKVTALSKKISGMVAKGKAPAKKDIHNYGIGCLTHVEARAKRKGISSDELQEIVFTALYEEAAVPKGLLLQ